MPLRGSVTAAVRALPPRARMSAIGSSVRNAVFKPLAARSRTAPNSSGAFLPDNSSVLARLARSCCNAVNGGNFSMSLYRLSKSLAEEPLLKISLAMTFLPSFSSSSLLAPDSARYASTAPCESKIDPASFEASVEYWDASHSVLPSSLLPRSDL